MDYSHYQWDPPMEGNMSDEAYINHLLLDSRNSLLTYTIHQPSTIALVCLYVPVLMTSFIGNILVILVVVRHRKCWGGTSNFLANLAFADLLVSTICLPMTVAQIVYVPWPYGTSMCKITAYAQGVAVTASTFTLTGMSLDRCLAVRYPIKFRRLRTSHNIRRLLLIVWLLSAALMSPLAVYKDTTTHALFHDIRYCVETWTVKSRQIYDLSLLILLYIIPCFVVIVSYGVMGRRLWVTDTTLKVSVKSLPSFNTADRRQSVLRGRRNFAKMIIAVSLLFALSWLPYYIVTIYIDFNSAKEQTSLMLTVSSYSLFLGHSNSATNPIIYCLMNPSFRRHLAAIFRCNTLPNGRSQFASGRSSRGFTTKGADRSLPSSLRVRSTATTFSNQSLRMTSRNKNDTVDDSS